MGSTLVANDGEKEILINRLYDETKSLLESLQSVIKKVEDVLNERESISKMEVKKYINEVL
jgi:hypothetical protein